MMEVIDKDFTAHFNGESWSVSWQWKGEEPNKVSVYSIKSEIEADFKKEVTSWIELQ